MAAQAFQACLRPRDRFWDIPVPILWSPPVLQGSTTRMTETRLLPYIRPVYEECEFFWPR
ncbi:hypothetical protein [Thiolapillus sp.]|uniref:hypothetical protein n=1 Tax=Thiolapillus sp. TaxID=2017437 RepID=UPI0025EA4F49|nr:hypothetical protein [Thiolapillus sp.]